jgi:hypothetical protein
MSERGGCKDDHGHCQACPDNGRNDPQKLAFSIGVRRFYG